MSDLGDARPEQTELDPPSVDDIDSPLRDSGGRSEPAAMPDAEATDDAQMHPDSVTDAGTEIDLDAIERDLNGVQAALERLNDGSYWTDEVSGDAIPNEVLEAFPLTRTVTSN